MFQDTIDKLIENKIRKSNKQTKSITYPYKEPFDLQILEKVGYTLTLLLRVRAYLIYYDKMIVILTGSIRL